jgi:hypothetical protein
MRAKLADVAASGAVVDDKPVDRVLPESSAAAQTARADADSLAGGPQPDNFAQTHTAEMAFRARPRVGARPFPGERGAHVGRGAQKGSTFGSRFRRGLFSHDSAVIMPAASASARPSTGSPATPDPHSDSSGASPRRSPSATGPIGPQAASRPPDALRPGSPSH